MEENIESSRQRSRRIVILGVVVAILAISAIAGLMLLPGGRNAGLPVDQFDARVADLAKIDPKLVLYREDSRVETGFSEARGLAVDEGGRIYVAGDRAIRTFDDSGSLESEVALHSEPYCLCVAEDGTIYVGMLGHVEVYDPSGRRLASWDSPGAKSYFTSVVSSGNDVWVADAGDRIVLHYNREGRLLRRIGQPDPSKDVPGLVVPSPHLDVFPGVDGSVWVANPGNHRLELRGPDGSLKRSWGKESFKIEGFSGCCNPTDFTMLPDGRFVTSEKGLPRVKIYSAEGDFECVVAGPEAFGKTLCRPDCRDSGLDVAVDARGRVFVLDPGTESVRIFARKENSAQ